MFTLTEPTQQTSFESQQLAALFAMGDGGAVGKGKDLCGEGQLLMWIRGQKWSGFGIVFGLMNRYFQDLPRVYVRI